MNPLQIVFLRLRITDIIAVIIIHISSPLIDAGLIARRYHPTGTQLPVGLQSLWCLSTHTAGLCSIGFLLAIRTAKLKLLMEMPDAGPITQEEYKKTEAAILTRM
jgi:hypothetical protein